MELVSEIPGFLKGQNPIIISGIFAASLSSALASLVGAPKIFQAICDDKIFPKINYFAKGHGKDNEPWRGYFLTFFISSAFIAIGDLNAIAPIISNFFLLSYALINYSCFDATVSKAPGWRPSFKYYNKWVSLLGAIICIFIMFVIKWWAALISFLVCASLYSFIKYRNPDINWGSSTQAQIYRKSLEYSLKLQITDEHVKNFRPNFLVLSGSVNKRPALVDLCSDMSKGNSLMICANIAMNKESFRDADQLQKYYDWMNKRKIKSFYCEVNNDSIRSGASCLIQSVGLGKLRPNTLMMGFKNNWSTDKVESTLDYFGIINDAFDMRSGLCILRLMDGLDYSDFFDDNLNNEPNLNDSDNKSDSEAESIVDFNNSLRKQKNIESLIQKKNVASWDLNNNNLKEATNNNPNLTRQMGSKKSSLTDSALGVNGKGTDLLVLKNTKINQGLLQGLNKFHKKVQTGFVDVWWLYDDGGLTLLLPYLLLRAKNWKKCKLRIFIQTKSADVEISEEQRR